MLLFFVETFVSRQIRVNFESWTYIVFQKFRVNSMLTELLFLWNLKNDLWLKLLKILAKTFKNTSFRLFALQPSTGKMIKR